MFSPKLFRYQECEAFVSQFSLPPTMIVPENETEVKHPSPEVCIQGALGLGGGIPWSSAGASGLPSWGPPCTRPTDGRLQEFLPEGGEELMP